MESGNGTEVPDDDGAIPEEPVPKLEGGGVYQIVIGLVTVTYMVMVESTSDEMLALVDVLMLEIKEDKAFVEMSLLFDERVVVEEVKVDEVGVGRQEHADEIRDGSPEQCDTKEGRPVVAVLSAVV